MSEYESFQELLMGKGVKLQLQVPIKSITLKNCEDKKSLKQSKLQYLRLWQFGRYQYLLYFRKCVMQ